MPATDFLSEARIRSARPDARPYKLRDGGGLYLLITPSDARLWQLRFKVHGRDDALPFISLALERGHRKCASERAVAALLT
jgi:hypothetical protein